jgi:hypothetical protein
MARLDKRGFHKNWSFVQDREKLIDTEATAKPDGLAGDKMEYADGRKNVPRQSLSPHFDIHKALGKLKWILCLWLAAIPNCPSDRIVYSRNSQNLSGTISFTRTSSLISDIKGNLVAKRFDEPKFLVPQNRSAGFVTDNSDRYPLLFPGGQLLLAIQATRVADKFIHHPLLKRLRECGDGCGLTGDVYSGPRNSDQAIS